MNMRAFFGTLIALLVLMVLIAQGLKLIWPPIEDEVYLIDDGSTAYATQYRPKAKPIVVRPAPRPPGPPKHHRLKTNLERFNRFEFDQRSIV